MSQSDNTKEKILKSAIKIFAKKGYWKTKVSDIVTDAGFAQGSFYNSFSSKEDCFKEILLILHNETILKAEIILKELDKEYKLPTLLKFLNKRFREIQDIAKVFLYEALTGSHELRQLYYLFKKRNFDIIYNILIELNADYPYEKAFLLNGFVKNMIETLIIEQKANADEVDTIIDNILKIVLEEK